MLECTRCSKKYPESRIRYLCDCGAVLEVVHKVKKPKLKGDGLQRYKEVLPVKRELITLNEGNTPLYKAENIGRTLGMSELYLKFEGLNPTGSFKDRGSCVVITKALELNAKGTTVASTGNMAASVAAYSAKAGLKCDVYVPAKTPDAKLAQISAYNGNILKVNGLFKDCVAKAKLHAHAGSYLAMTGLNPYYLEGEKTLGYELPKSDYVFLPMGTGGLLTATWKAFKEQGKKAHMVGVQAEDCSPIVQAFEQGHDRPEHIESARTIASAILVKTPFNGHTAIRALRESKGFGTEVNDFEILDSIKMLGREGVFAEPAAALPLSGLIKALDEELIRRDDKIILVITGHGLKDPSVLSTS